MVLVTRDIKDDRPLIIPAVCQFSGSCFVHMRDFIGRMIRRENKLTLKLIENKTADWLCTICACVCTKRK